MSPTATPSLVSFSLFLYLRLCLGNVISIRDPVTPWNRTEPIRASGKCNPNSFLWIPHRRGLILRQGDRIDGCDREKRGVENAHQRPSAAQFIITHTHTHSIYIHTFTYIHMCVYVFILGLLPRCQKLIFSTPRQMLPGCGRFRGFRRRKVSSVYIK